MTRIVIALLMIICASLSMASDTCSIVYGNDWAFLSSTPEGWAGACGDRAMGGTAITLWPSSQRSDTADALIYVTVSGKDFPTVDAFAADEQERFRKSSPSARITRLSAPTKAGKPRYILVKLSGAYGNREELEAYFDGPTAYFIVVLTAESASALRNHQADFMKYLSSFFTMEKRDGK